MQNYHLLPDGNQWIVTREGPRAPVVTFRSKRAAVDRVSEILSDRQASLKIHRSDGTVDEERMYPGAAHRP